MSEEEEEKTPPEESSAEDESPVLKSRDEIRDASSEALVKYCRQIAKAVAREVARIPKNEISEKLWSKEAAEELVRDVISDGKSWQKN